MLSHTFHGQAIPKREEVSSRCTSLVVLEFFVAVKLFLVVLLFIIFVVLLVVFLFIVIVLF
jgi:hypothetical protein